MLKLSYSRVLWIETFYTTEIIGGAFMDSNNKESTHNYCRNLDKTIPWCVFQHVTKLMSSTFAYIYDTIVHELVLYIIIYTKHLYKVCELYVVEYVQFAFKSSPRGKGITCAIHSDRVDGVKNNANKMSRYCMTGMSCIIGMCHLYTLLGVISHIILKATNCL